MRRKYGLAKIARYPVVSNAVSPVVLSRCDANCLALISVSIGFNLKNNKAVASKINPDIIQNTPRQLMMGIMAATGMVVVRAPQVPNTNIQLPNWLCRSAGYQTRYALSGAIKQEETPTPIMARPIHRPVNVELIAKIAAPTAANKSRADSVRLAPYLSNQLPKGSCILAKPRK